MSFRSRLSLAVPGAVAVLPALLWVRLAPAAAAPPAGYAFAALAAVVLLAWRFQRSRMAAAALLLAAAHGLAPRAGATALGLALAGLAPLLAILAAAGDRRLGAGRGLLQLALVPAAAGAAAGLLRRDPAGVAAWLAAPLADLPVAGLIRPAPGAALLGVLTLALIALRRGRALEAGLLWAAVAGSLGLAGPAGSRAAWMLGAALALGVALVEAAYALAFRDELTELPGRRALGSLLGGLRPPYAIAVVDVDHFKRFNDRHGHDVGDQVLRMVAARLGAVGGGGQAFRSGGEEFTLVFPGCTAEGALPHVEAVRRAVAGSPFVPRRRLRPPPSRGVRQRGTGSGARGLRVTISVGLAEARDRATPSEQVVKAADKAMYRAKQKGRNRVMA